MADNKLKSIIIKKNIIIVDNKEKDIKNALRDIIKYKNDKNLSTIDMRTHDFDFDFDIYNNLSPNGITVISK